jgi:triosephosphate isomerase (TIM)
MTMTTRRPLIAGNWKMHRSEPEAVALVNALKELLPARPVAEVVVLPPFTALAAVRAVMPADGRFTLGAQNCHWEKEGAFTGEVSAWMLVEAGCSFVLAGHSERRQLFGETDALVNKRARGALTAGLQPIVCIGETLGERTLGQTLAVCSSQLAASLAGISAEEMSRVTVAYEPVWAIGTGKNATPAQAQEVHAHIRQALTRLYGASVAEAVRIQYGGSVKGSNAAELLGQPDVDGALVGGASLDAASFAAICAAA